MITYARWHRDCSPDQPPQIMVRAAPAHGTLVIRPGPSTVSLIREGAPDCTGHVYPGTAIYYTPAPEFRGTERMEWDVMNGSTIAHDSAVVEVR